MDIGALDSGAVLLNEVHFAPENLEEFIELVNATDRPLSTAGLWLSLVQDSQLLRAEALDERRPYMDDPEFTPVLLPNEVLALKAPFSLPNDSCTLVLHTIAGEVLDEMTYWPLPSPLEHRSFERVALQTSGKERLNWHYHIPDLGQDSEGTPGAKNSVAGALPTLVAEAVLERDWVSFDPLNYQPTTVLWVGAGAGERVWAEVRDGSGRIMEVLLAGTGGFAEKFR